MAFRAQFPGTCARSDDEIRVGELIQYQPGLDEVEHVDCPKPRDVCSQCFVTLDADRSCSSCD